MSVWGLLTRPAPVADRGARAQALGVLFLTGGLLALLVVALAGERHVGGPVLAGIGVGSLLLGTLLLRWSARAPAWACHAVVIAGILAVMGAVVSLDGGTLPIAFGLPLIWVGLYVGHFFAPLVAAGHLALGLAGFAVALARFDQPVAVEVVMLAVVTVTVAGVSGWLAHHRTLSDVDALTGVLNRRGLTRRMELAMAAAERDRAPLTLALLDVDHFRRVNEVHGRERGDRLLLACARRWQQRLPDGACLARLGSDEFAVLLPGATPTQASETIEEMRGAAPDGRTCSAGVAPWTPGDTQSMLLARADTAMYEAKHAGRDRIAVLGNGSGLADELWQAVDEGQLSVHYQPIFALEDGALRGMEALVRWQHPERGLVPPGVFLPAAEESGAIHALDRWVLFEACRQVRAWQAVAACGEELLVTVNASPTRLRDPRLVADVRDALASSGLPEDALVLEITEGALQGDIEDAAAVLWELRSLGVHLAIDDFGTGHSSLARLRSLPFDVLKIDRSFVSALGGEHSAESLLSAILGMAASLGLTTVAEGVEEEDQLAVLRGHGCVHAQGFLLARPAPPAELEPRLDELAAPPVGRAAHPPVDIDLADVELSGVVADRQGRDRIEDLVRPLLAQVVRATGLEAAYLTWIDWEGAQQHVWVTHGTASLGIEEGDAVPWADSVCRRALLEGPRVTSEVARDLPAPAASDLRVRTYAVAPVSLTDGRLYGTLCAASDDARPVEPATQRLLELVARMIADHLERPATRSPSRS